VVVDVEDGDSCIVVVSTAGGRGTVPANRRPEVMLKELVAVVVVEIRSHLVEQEEVFDGTWLGALLLLHVLLSELDLACR
jgi:hypothetical protein